MTPTLPTPAEIAERAAAIYRARDSQPGQALDDWLQAEYELMKLPVEKIATLSSAKRKSALVSIVQAAFILGGSGTARMLHP